MSSSLPHQTWSERPSAAVPSINDTDAVFESLFTQSAEAMWLYDPQTATMVDCNQAAVKLIGAKNKEQLLRTRPEELSPPQQPDGSPSAEKSREIIAKVEKQKTLCFEWVLRRFDGTEVPVDVSSTALIIGGKSIQVLISRDISERKKAERELRELTQALERRVTERTAALSTSEARFRAMVEHAPEAIVVYSADTGRFLFGNQHACDLYGVSMSKLAELTPVDVSPEFQPCGGRSSELAREKIEEALAGGMAVFEWTHKKPDGQPIPVEVRLLRLPAEGQNLIRASMIDNTGRKCAERALRESEAKFRALFEGTSQGVVLHDENGLREANPAAVRIMGRQSLKEMLGKHPREMAPPFQPNGESSDAMARKHIDECMTTGTARFEWMASSPQGREIPLEVALTRIEWSGRQTIQAYITDIAERKRAQAALAESEARFSVAFHASPALIGILRSSDGKYVLVNDAHLNWLGYPQDEVLGRTCLELNMWEDPEERDALLKEVQNCGSIRHKECRWRNRRGERLTVLVSIETIKVNDTPHLLSMALDITQRKRAEEELRASEARLRESEARFSVAFEASPMFINILRISDGKYVWANDAFVNRLGYSREEVLDRASTEFGMWADPAEREAAWEAMRTVGSIRQREVRWLDRHGEPFTILLSAEIIKFNDAPHILSLALDITQRKRAEEELLKTLAREKELSQLKSNFVSMVSHEFRTPLGIIQSSTELLRDFHGKMQTDERDEQLASIVRNTRRMAGMMEEVLVLSRLDAGKLMFEPGALDLNGFFRRVVDEVLSATSRRCGIELSLTSLPSHAQADERLLAHIFTNLLSNAVKYSEAGATVHIFVARQDRDAVCTIRDKGIGIPEEDRQHLFKAFHRGSNVGTCPGTGLGLLLVKRCADLHGATVQLESRVGEGTTVTIRIPAFNES